MPEFPKDSTIVFEGSLFKVHQWKQRLYDGSYAVFEGVSRPDTATVLAEMDGQICYTVQHQPHKPGPFYALLGGRVDVGETPLEAARRELLEEGGLESDDWELLHEFDPISKMDWTVHVYIARNCRKTAEAKLDTGEKIELRRMPFDDFVRDILPHPDFIEKWLKLKLLTEPNAAKISELKEKLGLES